MDELHEIGTDCATLAVFHPDDLAHRAADPLDWYVDDSSYRAESETGRLVAFVTGRDGGYVVRLTDGGLTHQEAEFACTPWVFPLAVRHGKVLLDNTDALPSDACYPEPANWIWFELANGAYRVTVHPIARRDASLEESEALPDYVIAFASVPNFADVAVSEGLPDLRPERNWRPAPISRSWENSYLWTEATLSTTRFPALRVPDDVAVLPRQPTARLPFDADTATAVHRIRDTEPFPTYAVAPSFNAGDLVALARQTSGSTSAWPRDARGGLTLTGQSIVRVTSTSETWPLAWVEVERIAMPECPRHRAPLRICASTCLNGHAPTTASSVTCNAAILCSSNWA